MNVFDIVNNLLLNKKPELKNEEEFDKLYNPYLINKALSFHMDTIMFANEMNRYPFLSKDMQYDFYFASIKPKKRYSKWFKKDETDQDKIDLISEYYNCNETRAKEYLKILKPEQIQFISKKLNKGGR